jgi:hypothetical protein
LREPDGLLAAGGEQAIGFAQRAFDRRKFVGLRWIEKWQVNHDKPSPSRE